MNILMDYKYVNVKNFLFIYMYVYITNVYITVLL